jgi:hypothetical protein
VKTTRKENDQVSRPDRITALVTAPLAVALWAAGLAVANTPSAPDSATDAQILTWVHDHKNAILLGSWLFMTGCLAFLFFVGVLRSRLAAAEGDNRTFSSIAFAAGVMMAVFGIGGQADIASAINADSISAATAGTLHHAGDVMFVGAELCFTAFLVAIAVLSFRAAVLPRWWAAVGLVVAVVAYIGPIGWAALIFGLPVWLLVTTALLVRSAGRPRVHASVVEAV